MPIPRLPTPASVGVDSVSPPPAGKPHSRTEALLHRTLLLRCLLVTALATVLGATVTSVLLPLLSPEAAAEVLSVHLPTESTLPALFWLRLCAARVPFCLLLALAGLTRFSGGLTTAVLGFRGLADGAALCLLSAMGRGEAGLAWSSALSPAWAAAAYVLWVLIDGAARHWLAAEARRFAQAVTRLESEAAKGSEPTRPALRYLLWKYLSVCLATLSMTLAACGLYTAMLL